MTKNKSLYIAPKLHDFGGNLSKAWYIEYSVYSPSDGKKIRMRESKFMNAIDNVDKRYEYCHQKMAELLEMIKHRKLACQTEEVTYNDELVYDKQARIYGNIRVNKVTIRTYLNDFLKVKKAEVIPHTYTTYKSKLRIFADWCDFKKYSSLDISEWTQKMIVEFFYFIYEKNSLSRMTIRKYNQILSSFFWYLKDTKGVIDRNPVYNIPRLGDVVDEAPVPIPLDVMQRIHDYMVVFAPQLWLVCIMQYYCAIRPGQELRLLKIGDINFDGHFIVIRKELAKNRQRESIDIPDQLYHEMIDTYHLDKYSVDYYVFGKCGIPGTDCLGKNTFRYRFDSIRSKLNLPTMYKLYSFKHSGAVALINSGFNTQDLQRHMRHRSLSSTEHYIRKNIGEHNVKLQKNFPDILEKI